MPKHHDRRHGGVQGAKEPRSRSPRIPRFGVSGALTGAWAPLSRPFLPQREIHRSQSAAIYEFMAWITKPFQKR